MNIWGGYAQVQWWWALWILGQRDRGMEAFKVSWVYKIACQLPAVPFAMAFPNWFHLHFFYSTYLPFSSSQGDEKNPLQKLTSPRHQTPCVVGWCFKKSKKRPSNFEMVLLFKTPLKTMVDSPYQLVSLPPTTTRPSNRPSPKLPSPRQVPEAEFGEPGFFTPPKKNNVLLFVPVDLGWFFLLGWCFFLFQQFLFRHTCFLFFLFPVVWWWFAYVCEGVMIAIL